MLPFPPISLFFFFNDTATTEIYTLSLHDALPILVPSARFFKVSFFSSSRCFSSRTRRERTMLPLRSEEHTSELQSHLNLVCRLLLEKKKKTTVRLLVTSSVCATLSRLLVAELGTA